MAAFRKRRYEEILQEGPDFEMNNLSQSIAIIY